MSLPLSGLLRYELFKKLTRSLPDYFNLQSVNLPDFFVRIFRINKKGEAEASPDKRKKRFLLFTTSHDSTLNLGMRWESIWGKNRLVSTNR